MQFINRDRPFIINSEIIEWDIKSANLSIIKEYSLLDEAKIRKIETLGKKDRVVFVGKEMRADKNFGKELEKLFDVVVNEFMDNNDLDIDYDIISVKKDAVYVVNKDIKHPSIGNHINFVPKSKYRAFLYIKPFEFYFTNSDINVKGLNDSLAKLHEKGMLVLLRDIVQICESGNMNFKRINSYLSEFVKAYKNRELEFDYYREFNHESMYRYIAFENQMMMETIDETVLNSIDIQHNYINIILPLIQNISY